MSRQSLRNIAPRNLAAQVQKRCFGPQTEQPLNQLIRIIAHLACGKPRSSGSGCCALSDRIDRQIAAICLGDQRIDTIFRCDNQTFDVL